MKHDVSFVTCVYDDIHNTNLAGRHNRGTHYAFSLAQMHTMGAPIYCFTDKINMYKFFPSFLYHGYENFNFLSYNLWDSPYHREIQRVKEAKPEEYLDGVSWRQRCVEIMWAKFDWIMHIAENYTGTSNQDKYLFWIDGGLSHEGIFPKAFNSIHGNRTYNSVAHEYHERFYIDGVFNAGLPDHLVESMEGKDLLHFICSQPQHSDPHPFPNIPKKYIGTAAGGLFGGKTGAMYEWAKGAKVFCDELLRENYLLKEEDILSHQINVKYDELGDEFDKQLKVVEFNTWYHEDWDVYDPNDISFSDYFKPLLNYGK